MTNQLTYLIGHVDETEDRVEQTQLGVLLAGPLEVVRLLLAGVLGHPVDQEEHALLLGTFDELQKILIFFSQHPKSGKRTRSKIRTYFEAEDEGQLLLGSEPDLILHEPLPLKVEGAHHIGLNK